MKFVLIALFLWSVEHQGLADDEINSNIETTTSSSSAGGFAPFFTYKNRMYPLIAKPSGNMLELKCIAQGNPEPRIQWTKDGEKIYRKTGNLYYGQWSMIMGNLVSADSGIYKCNVCNVHGCISFETKVEIIVLLFNLQFGIFDLLGIFFLRPVDIECDNVTVLMKTLKGSQQQRTIKKRRRKGVERK